MGNNNNLKENENPFRILLRAYLMGNAWEETKKKHGQQKAVAII
jgi:hypothetical protein